jgi:DNA modification methylase
MSDISIPCSALEVRYKATNELTPDARNPRSHKIRGIRQIAKSIEAFGFAAPILINGDGQVIAGHGRLAAAKLLNMPTVPTISLAHLNERQRQAYMVADNRLAELSRWDRGALAEVMLELSEADLTFDLDAAGFSVAEIDLMAVQDDIEDLPDEISADQPSVVQFGELWVLGDHLVLCGSALDKGDVRRLMGTRKADAVFSDPPYNVPVNGHVSGLGKVRHREFGQASGEMSESAFIAFLEAAFRNAADWSRDGSLHYWAMDWRHLHELTMAARAVYDEQVNLCVWNKTNAGMGSLYRSQHELFVVWRKGTLRHRNNVELGRFGRSRTNVWSYPGANSFGRASDEGNLLSLHPTVKPVALVADAIQDSTKRGDIVLDPFLGSGSTVIAAEKVGRRCRGIELDPLYVDVVIRRWQRWTGEQALRQADSMSFDAIESETRAAASPAASAQLDRSMNDDG